MHQLLAQSTPTDVSKRTVSLPKISLSRHRPQPETDITQRIQNYYTGSKSSLLALQHGLQSNPGRNSMKMTHRSQVYQSFSGIRCDESQKQINLNPPKETGRFSESIFGSKEITAQISRITRKKAKLAEIEKREMLNESLFGSCCGFSPTKSQKKMTKRNSPKLAKNVNAIDLGLSRLSYLAEDEEHQKSSTIYSSPSTIQ